MKTVLIALALLGQPAATEELPAAPPAAVLDFEVEGPTEVVEGEMVPLTIMFPEGALADVDFVPVEEEDFEVDPVIQELADGTVRIVGRKCTFSARCLGRRKITVVATAFATLADGRPRVKSIKHVVAVKERVPLPDDPTTPPDDGGWVPIPKGASSTLEQRLEELRRTVEENEGKTALILDKMLTKLERVEADAANRSAPKSGAASPAPTPAAAPAPAKTAAPGGMVVAVCGVPVTPYPYSPTPVRAEVRDARAGHWSVASARSPWTPTKSETIAHLRSAHPSTARAYEPLESRSHEELLSLHDTSHEGGSVQRSAPAARYMPAGGCPGGVCPTGVRRGLFGLWR